MTQNKSATDSSANPDDQTIEVILFDPQPTSFEPRATTLISLPQVCTCCLKPTTSRAEVRWGRQTKSTVGVNRVITTRSAKMEFFVCEECLAHEKEFENKLGLFRSLVVLFSSGISTVLIILFQEQLNQLPEPMAFMGGFVLLPAFIAFVLILLLDLFIRLAPLDKRHASRTKGVTMTGSSSFEFDNLLYAQAFAKANTPRFNAEARTKKTYFTNKVHGKSLLERGPLGRIILSGALLSVVFTFILSLLSAMILVEPFASSPAGPWCGGIGILLVVGFILSVFKK